MSDDRREMGMTLVELTVGVGLAALVAVLAGTSIDQLSRVQRQTRAYCEDVEHCRRALRAVEADLRASASVVRRGDGFRLTRSGSLVDYDLAAGTLTRMEAGRSRVVARRIASLTLDPEGDLVHLRLVLMPRRKAGGRRAVVTTDVCCRGGGR